MDTDSDCSDDTNFEGLELNSGDDDNGGDNDSDNSNDNDNNHSNKRILSSKCESVSGSPVNIDKLTANLSNKYRFNLASLFRRLDQEKLPDIKEKFRAILYKDPFRDFHIYNKKYNYYSKKYLVNKSGKNYLDFNIPKNMILQFVITSKSLIKNEFCIIFTDLRTYSSPKYAFLCDGDILKPEKHLLALELNKLYSCKKNYNEYKSLKSIFENKNNTNHYSILADLLKKEKKMMANNKSSHPTTMGFSYKKNIANIMFDSRNRWDITRDDIMYNFFLKKNYNISIEFCKKSLVIPDSISNFEEFVEMELIYLEIPIDIYNRQREYYEGFYRNNKFVIYAGEDYYEYKFNLFTELDLTDEKLLELIYNMR